MKKEKFAFVSISDKRNLDFLSKELVGLGYTIIASLKTAKYIKELGLPVTDVAKLTGYPAIVGLQGIKIIHPKIFAGVLADPNNEEHLKDLKKYKIPRFEIVVCNFYPFEKTIKKSNFTHEEAIFNLDIGGPAIVRCAAKNYKNVNIVTDIKDYQIVIRELKSHRTTNLSLRQGLSLKAFKYCLNYDNLIVKYLSNTFKDEADK